MNEPILKNKKNTMWHREEINVFLFFYRLDDLNHIAKNIAQ